MPEHQPRRRFGQNFLHDPRVIARIVDAIDPRIDEHLVEIGPGQAALTRELIARAGHLTAIEIDRDLAQRLRQQFTPSQLTLLEGDALKFDWGAFAKDAELRLVGNLPYNISTPLLFRLAEIAENVRDQHFMLQKEVVDRIVAPPGSKTYGRLSVMLQYRYRLAKLFDVPRGAFSPAPKVTSSVVRMIPRAKGDRPDIDGAALGRVVTAAFGQRRKTLRNSLSTLLDADQIAAAGIDPKGRAETLSLEQFVELTRRVVPPAV